MTQDIDASALVDHIEAHGPVSLRQALRLLRLPRDMPLAHLAMALRQCGRFRRVKKRTTGQDYWTLTDTSEPLAA
jgi:hypothetical protein